ncbi:MAG TPA: hypothetical protein DCE41_17795, partial [Cytophagales bacterium]|nr:hypothetical protein [Cytophagales bacterium]
MKLDLSSRRATPTKLTSTPGIYRTPAFSPNGQQLVYWKEGGNGAQGYTHSEEPGIYLMSV